MQKATFAAGCFWGVEAAFQKIKGVKDTKVGYTGGKTKNPTYEKVCANQTGHAEAIQIIYDPEETTYEQLLEVFWEIHDPTQLNRQGPDVGTQYRSAIFYHDEKQKGLAEISKNDIQPSLPTLTGIRADYLKGVTGDGRVVLDDKKLLTDKKMCINL